jgi:hypothetical protein
MLKRRKKPIKPISRNDSRTGEEYLNEWIASIGNCTKAEDVAGLCRGHFRVWVYDPHRGFSADVALKIAEAANCPIECLMYRNTPIRELHFWRFTEKSAA